MIGTVQGVQIECGRCGVTFWMTEALYKIRRRDHQSFWCPNGCERVFTSLSDVELARRERDEARAARDKAWVERDKAERLREAEARKNARLRKRAKAGVCAFCHRTFGNMARHMATQHAEVAP
jgi:hypothetical protein